MHSGSPSPRGLAATALVGLALLILPASASAQEPAPWGDPPQSMSVMGSGRPNVDAGMVRTRFDEPKARVRRGHRTKVRAAAFGKVKRTKPGRVFIQI
jgi:hypothetical protein